MKVTDITVTYRVAVLVAVLGVLVASPRHAFGQNNDPPPAGVQSASSGGAASIAQGAVSSSLPFDMPAARGDAQPGLSLSYSSRDAVLRDAATGWGIALPSITRAPLSGWPGYNDPSPGDDLATLARKVAPGDQGPALDRFAVGGVSLVPVCTVGKAQCPKEQMPNWAAGWHYFRPQQDTYIRFFWRPNGQTWRVVYDSGLTEEYGAPLTAPGAGGPALDLDTSSGKPFRWNLARRFDPIRDGTGRVVNVVVYVWDFADANLRVGPIVLHDVYDTPASAAEAEQVTAYAHHAHLEWEPNGLPVRLNTPTWRAAPTHRLKRLDVASKTWDGTGAREPVRRFHLTYANVGARPFLTTFEVEGRCDTSKVEQEATITVPCTDPSRQCVPTRKTYVLPPTDCKKLPPIRFGYQPELLDAFQPKGEKVAPARSWTSLPFGHGREIGEATLTTATFMDATSDGLPDIIVPPTYPKKPYFLYINQGNDFAPTDLLAPIDSNGSAAYPLFDGTELLAPADGTSLIGEWSALGKPAVIFANLSNRNFTTDDRVFTIGFDGKSWKWEPSEVRPRPRLRAFDRAADIDGDGIVDLRRSPLAPGVPSTSTQASTSFSRRYSSGVVTPAETLAPDAIEKTCWLSPKRSDFADMDGDGLVDQVLIASKLGALVYFPGNGRGQFGCGSGDARCTRNTGACPKGPGYVPVNVGVPGPNGLQRLGLDGEVSIADLNGDGFADAVDELNSTQIRLFLNWHGQMLAHETTVTRPPDALQNVKGTRLVLQDMNGNGTTDVALLTVRGVHYFDLLPAPAGNPLATGTRPALLTRVDNGLGALTELTYASTTELDKSAKPSWTTHSPRPMYAVTTLRATNKISAPTGVDRLTRYLYTDASYDGWSRALRGFGAIRIVEEGDVATPGVINETHFIVSECHRLPTPGPHCFESIPDSDPESAIAEWANDTKTTDASGQRWISDTIWTPKRRELLKANGAAYPSRGLDGRYIFGAHTAQIDTWLYDPDAPSSENTIRWTVLDPKPTCPPTIECPPGYPVEREIVLGPKKGRVHLRQRFEVDQAHGHVTLIADDGRVGDETPPKDPTIARHASWIQVSPETGWMWRAETRTTDPFPHVQGVPDGLPRVLKSTYNTFGLVTDVDVTLTGTLPLQRSHEDPSQTPPAPVGASPVGAARAVRAAHFEYDGFGNVVKTTTPNGGCQRAAFDGDRFNQFPTTMTTFTGGCDDGPIEVGQHYDRGFGLVDWSLSATAARTSIEYDLFGRLKSKTLPSAVAGLPATGASVTVDYDLGDPITKVKTSVRDSSSSWHESWSYVDGFGTALVSLTEADKTAGKDKGAWIARGLPMRSRLGVVVRVSDPWFYDGKPDEHPVAYDASRRYASVQYDAFQRPTASYEYDAAKGAVVQTSKRTYGPLWLEVQDAESVKTGGRHTGKQRIEIDGHGRTERVLASGKGSEGTIDTTWVKRSYLATGEVAAITQGHDGGSDRVTRWMQYDSLGRVVLNAEPNTVKNFVLDPNNVVAIDRMRAWRYAYDDRGLIVGTSDPRGCGKNLHYDQAGRLFAEDYWPCLNNQLPYTEPDLVTGKGTEAFTRFQEDGLVKETFDRAEHTTYTYDGRNRVVGTEKQLAKPGAPVDDLQQRYAAWTFRAGAEYDEANRVTTTTTGADVDDLLKVDPTTGLRRSFVRAEYTARGLLKTLTSSYGLLVESETHSADGLVDEVVYGDAAGTRAKYGYDGRRRLETFAIDRSHAPASWSTTQPGEPTRQLLLESTTLVRDDVGNLLEAKDGRTASEWPAGAKPVSRTMAYDDFYRLTSVTYDSGGDGQVSPFARELRKTPRTIIAPTLQPSPNATKRVTSQTFGHDWKGNTTKLDDDAHAFFERSIGTIVNGESLGKPNQLVGAGPAMTNPAAKDGVHAQYDDAGNLALLIVGRARCTDAGGKCSHAYLYEWDEVGHIASARRYDAADVRTFDHALGGAPSVELRYTYGSNGRRARKTVVDTSTASPGAERHSIDVFPSLRLEGAAWKDATQEYERTAATEQVYLSGLGRVAYLPADAVGASSGRSRLLLRLSDTLGSTSAVIDHATGELVERATYQAYGAMESDYRPERWGSFRDEYKFTGKEEDLDVGLVYFGARYYQPQLGRWASPDPLTVHRAGADLNPYAYVGGSPTNFTDPIGLQCSEGQLGSECKAGSSGIFGDAEGWKNAFSDAGDWIKNTGRDVVQWTGNTARDVWNGAEDIATSAWDGVTDVTSSIADSFKGPELPPQGPPNKPTGPVRAHRTAEASISQTKMVVKGRLDIGMSQGMQGVDDVILIMEPEGAQGRESFRTLAEQVTGGSFGPVDRSEYVPAAASAVMMLAQPELMLGAAGEELAVINGQVGDAIVFRQAVSMALARGEKLTTLSGLNTVASGERIAIVAHGTAEEVGGLSAETLSEVVNASGQSPTVIDLVSCNSGTGRLGPEVARRTGAAVKVYDGRVNVTDGVKGVPQVKMTNYTLFPVGDKTRVFLPVVQ